MVKSILLCVEEGFETSKPAFEWAARHLIHSGDALHVVTVMSPNDYVAPEAGISAFATDAVVLHYEAQKRQDELKAADTLKQASDFVKMTRLNLGSMECHALNAIGGASGVAASLVQYANSKKVDLAVLGSRGGGALQRSLRSVVGLGSVSDYAVHNMHCPILVVREGCNDQSSPSQTNKPCDQRSVCLACDDTDQSKAMVQWTLRNVTSDSDDIHVVSVAKPLEYAVSDPVLDTSTTVINLENSTQMEAIRTERLRNAEKTAKEFVTHIKSCGVPLDNVWYKALHAEGGASGVSESLMHYADTNHNTMIVVGNRDLGFIKRAVSTLLGLDSVSEHLAHNAPCPVLIFKQ